MAGRRRELQLRGRSPGDDDRLPASRRVQEIRAPRTGRDEHEVRCPGAQALQDDAHRATVHHRRHGSRAELELCARLAGATGHCCGRGVGRDGETGLEPRRPEVIRERRFQ